MARRISRKLELFAMHAHNGTVDYPDIFDKLRRVKQENRVIEVGALVLALPIIRRVDDDQFYIQVTEGDPNAATLVLDRATGGTRESVVGDTEVISEATHLLVAPNKRRATIEYVRRGAKAVIIGAAIERILKANYPAFRSLTFEFAPVVSENFSREVGRFERIREASIRVVRPNASWSDHYTELSQLMEQSNGAKAELDVRAGRGESLSKNTGIVKVVQDVVSDEQPYLDEAKIVGTRVDESAETTVRASRYIVHTQATIPTDGAGVPTQTGILESLKQFLRAWT